MLSKPMAWPSDERDCEMPGMACTMRALALIHPGAGTGTGTGTGTGVVVIVLGKDDSTKFFCPPSHRRNDRQCT